MEQSMNKLTIVGAAALFASAAAVPALAQDMAKKSAGCDQSANCEQMRSGAPGMRTSLRGHRGTAYRMRRAQREPLSGGQRMATGYGENGYYAPRGYAPRGYYAEGYYGPNRYHDPYWGPADAAAGVVGGAVATAGAVAAGAVNTAGAIATAPFRASNAYYTGADSWDHRTWAERNQFVCTPGKFFKGDDGQQHMCQ